MLLFVFQNFHNFKGSWIRLGLWDDLGFSSADWVLYRWCVVRPFCYLAFTTPCNRRNFRNPASEMLLQRRCCWQRFGDLGCCCVARNFADSSFRCDRRFGQTPGAARATILGLPGLKRAQSGVGGFSHRFRAITQGQRPFGLRVEKFHRGPWLMVRWCCYQTLVFLHHTRSVAAAAATPGLHSFLLGTLYLLDSFGVLVPAPLLWLREPKDRLALPQPPDWSCRWYDLASSLLYRPLDPEHFPELHFMWTRLGWWISLVIDQILTKQVVIVSYVTFGL